MSPLPSISQAIPQTLIPPPKPQATPEQLALQNQLIAACKQGDEKAAKALLQKGAKPDMANTKGEQPLGAAVWGMCPDVVNALLKQAGGVAPMTWQECEKHNLKYYKEVFIVPKFAPYSFEEWNTLLQKMDPNPFVRALHLRNVDEQWNDNNSSSWVKLRRYVETTVRREGFFACSDYLTKDTEEEFVSYRSQIKQGIESAKQPMVALHF